MNKKRIGLTIGAALAAAILAGGGFFAGFRDGERFPQTVVVKGIANPNPADNVDFGTFWQAWQILNDEYLRNASTTNQQKVYGAIAGLVDSLNDPYTEFFTPKDSQQFQQDVEGNFGGIGAEIGTQKNQVVVIAPLKDTPASRAGLLAGDQILKINATSTDGMGVDQAVSLIRGPEGTKVTLSIMRKSFAAPEDFTITREKIQAPTLDYSMKGNILYVQLYSFNGNAESLFYKALLSGAAHNAQGMILDLRDNPGGYLEVAEDLAGWFLPRGTLVVSEEGRDGVSQPYYAAGNGSLAKFPMVVLINGGSASAAEILAGTLRDNLKVKLIGEQSFGKGTVQQLENLRDGSSLKVTIAHWVLPSGQILENGGLKPDIEVKLTEDDIKNGRDPQLDKALEIIKSEF